MNYSQAEIRDLILFLTSFGDTYEFVRQFFLGNYFRLDCGLKEPGSVGSAYVIDQMKRLFPDVYFALKMPEEDLPLYINKEVGQEYPIALWRLSRSQPPSSG